MVFHPVSLASKLYQGTNPWYVLVHPKKRRKGKIKKNTKKKKTGKYADKKGREKERKRSKQALRAQAESLGDKIANVEECFEPFNFNLNLSPQ